MIASYQPYRLQFKNPVLTSRGLMTYKNGYYMTLEHNGTKGIGECSYIEGLSVDRLDSFEKKLKETCAEIWQIADEYYENGQLPPELLRDYPALAFGLETALLDLENGGKHEVISGSAFMAGQKDIPINGLVWMGSDTFMQQQIEQKLTDGFRCIKIKVAAIDFAEECRLIENIRKHYGPEQIEIRLDANGGFNAYNVRERLQTLSQFDIHSIEQPVKPQQYLLMHQLCAEKVIPIALDEELIGTWQSDIQYKLLETVRPQYIILKPSLLGGLTASNEWIKAAEKLQIRWWATSALESNIGLNAVAQWACSKETNMVQGLGTGGLYQNNIDSPLYIEQGHLKYNTKKGWKSI